MNRDKRIHQQGFTLIELTLAMAFIAMLMLAIAMSILQISQSYNQGLTYKEVDAASRTIADDITKDVNATTQFGLDAGSHRYITQPWGGSLCLGRYSYVWNYGGAVDTYNKNPQPSSLNLLVDSAGKSTTLNIVKVLDVNASMCADSSAKSVVSDNAVELLRNTDHDLAIHQFCISTQPSANDPLTGQQLYTLGFSIGTNNVNALTSLSSASCQGTNENDGLQACKNAGEEGADLQYCTIQEFSIVLRTQHGVN